jgi:hypothetical protein
LTQREVQEAMGIMTTDAEAAAMLELLTARGITELDQISDKEFVDLIPEAILRSQTSTKDDDEGLIKG